MNASGWIVAAALTFASGLLFWLWRKSVSDAASAEALAASAAGEVKRRAELEAKAAADLARGKGEQAVKDAETKVKKEASDAAHSGDLVDYLGRRGAGGPRP